MKRVRFTPAESAECDNCGNFYDRESLYTIEFTHDEMLQLMRWARNYDTYARPGSLQDQLTRFYEEEEV